MDPISWADSSTNPGQPVLELTHSTLSETPSGLSIPSGYGLSVPSSGSENLALSPEGMTDINPWFRGDRPNTTLHGIREKNHVIEGATHQANVLFGYNGSDRIRGGNKDDVLNGGRGRDVLLGGHGHDLLVGGSGNDRLRGGNGNDILKGHSGRDRLWGGKGHDYLDGGAGIDRLYGGAGNDILVDYEGGDRLTGGPGADLFGVGSPFATRASIITDFKVGKDQIKILRLGATFEDLTFKENRGRSIVMDQGRAIALLLGVKANRLTPDSFTFGKAQLADELQQNLDQLLILDPEVTGISTMVMAPDGTVWAGTAGLSDLETQAPIEIHDLFGAGSITKPIIATTVLQLKQEGKLNLDDTLSQWLPDQASKIPNAEQITIRQLLNHTSGIRNYETEPELLERFLNDPTVLSQTFSNQDLLAVIEGKPALFAPGQNYAYGNTGYLLLGEIIEKAADSTLASQLRQRIFTPLGMKHTFYAIQEQIEGNLTQSYQDLNGDGQLNALNENLSWTSSAGGIVSTAADLTKFARALFQGELLAPDLLQMMITEGSMIDPGGDLGLDYYGLGVASGTQPNVGKVVGHDGATAGWASQMYYSPDRNITAVVMATAPYPDSSEIGVIQSLKKTAQLYPVEKRRMKNRH